MRRVFEEDRVTGYRRRAKGEEQPRSAYADFLEKIEITELSLKSASIAKCKDALDWRARRVLCDKWPREYRDRVVQELTGVDVQALPVTFKVGAYLRGQAPWEFTIY